MRNTVVEGRIHVAVGVVVRGNEVLIGQRFSHQHQGGKWEFPGGKVGAGEGVLDALRRELREELGITVRHAAPLIQIPYDYEDRRVLLDVCRVSDFDGKPEGREGQAVRWVSRSVLTQYEFPPANRGIVLALQLPSLYLISDLSRFAGPSEFLESLERALSAGARLIQLREHQLDDGAYSELAQEVIRQVRAHGGRVLLNRDPVLAARLDADGVHLNSQMLCRFYERPLPPPALVAASCHTETELRKAERIDTDFVVLSPVQRTASHPQAEAMGWERFGEFCAGTRIPVYALGGMLPRNLDDAIAHGGQGLAMIRGIWAAPSIAQAVMSCQRRDVAPGSASCR